MPEPTMTDDELERLLRASTPYPPALERGLSLRAQTDLERIMRGPARSRRTRRWAWGISVPAVAVAVVALVVALVVNPLAPPTPAAAQGLPPLTYAQSALGSDEAIDLAQSLLAGSPGAAEPIRESTTVAWYSHIQMDGPDRGTVISPEVTTWTWDAEAKTSRIVTTAGEQYQADGTPIPTREDVSPPGTVLRDDRWGEEAWSYEAPDGTLVPLPIALEGSSVEFYREVMREWTGAEPTGFDVLSGIPQLLAMWTLTNEQHANLLELLRDRDDVEFLGTTTDRAARDVLAFASTNASGLHTLVLLVSADTGRVVGSETIFLGDDPDIPIPTDSVMSYQMWETAPPHR